MAMFFASVALCLSGSAFAQIITSGSCPDVEVQENLDPVKILGKWYEQARFFTMYEGSGECAVFDYFVDEKSGIPMVNHTITSSITGEEDFYATELLTPNPEEPARLVRKHPRSPILGYNNLMILGTDYDNWLAVFGCNDLCSISVQYAWIVTRVQVPDESVVASAYAVMKQNNVDTSQLVRVEQKKCRKLLSA